VRAQVYDVRETQAAATSTICAPVIAEFVRQPALLLLPMLVRYAPSNTAACTPTRSASALLAELMCVRACACSSLIVLRVGIIDDVRGNCAGACVVRVRACISTR
jgi:hypothetical protein